MNTKWLFTSFFVLIFILKFLFISASFFPSNPLWSCFCSFSIIRPKVIGGNLIQLPCITANYFFPSVYLMVSHCWVLLNVTTSYLLHYFYCGNKLPKMSKFGSNVVVFFNWNVSVRFWFYFCWSVKIHPNDLQGSIYNKQQSFSAVSYVNIYF